MAARMAPLPDLVIFDCDGVLVDSEPISNTVLARALTAAGLPTSPEDALRTYKGRIMSDVVAVAESKLGSSLPPGFVERFESDRLEEFRRSLGPIPGAGAAVRVVSAAGVKVCVASQGKPEKTELTLGITGLRELFGADALFSAYSVARGKPHPDLFLHAARSMGAGAERTVVIEDTSIGVTAAVAAGMRVLGFAPDDDGATLTEAGAAEVLPSLAELPARLGIA
jgi:beta-phosphoglucomutase-like phosphatase (HAD superfamily)